MAVGRGEEEVSERTDCGKDAGGLCIVGMDGLTVEVR